MLQNIKNDLMYLLNILESIEKILLYSCHISNAETFYELNDQLNFNATLNLLANIGENVGKISDELKEKYNDIEWKSIKNFRNRVVHDYINIDTLLVFDIINVGLPKLKAQLFNIIQLEISSNTFDVNEFNEAKSSFYYRHIDFSVFS